MGGAENFIVVIDYDWKSHIRIDLLERIFGMVALKLIDNYGLEIEYFNVSKHSDDRAEVTIEVIAVNLHFLALYSLVKYLLRVSLRS